MANKNARSQMAGGKKNHKKYRRIKINGVVFNLIPRSDGRFNLSREGASGAQGSTAIVSAVSYKEAMQHIARVVNEIRDEENALNAVKESQSATITAEEYEENIELPPNNAFTRAADSANAATSKVSKTVGLATAKTTMNMGKKLEQQGASQVSDALRQIQAAGNSNDFLGRKIDSLRSFQNRKMNESLSKRREKDNALERFENNARREMFRKYRQANLDAVEASKETEYKEISNLEAQLQVKRTSALERKDTKTLALVNQEAAELSARKKELQKRIPENVSLPYPKVGIQDDKKGVEWTSTQRKKVNKYVETLEYKSTSAQARAEWFRERKKAKLKKALKSAKATEATV
jgi:hypothetical protein